MPLVLADRVYETSVTTGTGALTLDGAVSGYRTFSTLIGNGNTTYYTIWNKGALAEYETGIGTVSAGVLTRTTVLQSSNANAAVNLSAGTKDVFCTLVAQRIPHFLKILYANENLQIEDNTQQTGAGSITFTGTGSLTILGTGRLALL